MSTEKFIQVVQDDGQTYKIMSNATNFKTVKKMIQSTKYTEKELLAAISIKENINRSSNFKIKNNDVFYENVKLPEYMSNRIIAFFENGLDLSYLENFWKRLQKNSIKNNVENLYKFLCAQGHAITQDGCFLAYKAVNDDFKDKYTGKILNLPNTWVYMPPSEVNDDPTVGCSYGLHVGNWDYVQQYSQGHGKIILVRVAPEDVICIPEDYSFQKMRTCKYFVIEEYKNSYPLESEMVKVKVPTNFSQSLNKNKKPARDSKGRFIKS